MAEGTATPETTSPQRETLPAKENVIVALKSGLDIMKTAPPAETDVEGKQRWQYQIVEIEERLKDIENGGEGTKIVELKRKNGAPLKPQEEGIPVDSLLRSLTQKIDDPTTSKAGRARILKIRANLAPHWKEYHRLPNRRGNIRYDARIDYEVEQMQKDGRSTGDLQKDKDKAQQILNDRKEFFIPNPDSTVPVSEEKFIIGIVNYTQMRDKRAEEVAQTQLTEQLHMKKWWSPKEWFRVTKLRVGEQYYRELWTQRAKDLIDQTENPFAEIDVVKNSIADANKNREEHRKEQKSTVERFIEAEAKERSFVGVGEEVITSQDQAINQRVNTLLSRFARGEIDEAQLKTEQNQLFTELETNPSTAGLFKDCKMYADNLLEVAKAVKQQYRAHKILLNNLDHQVTVQLGNASLYTKTEQSVRLADKFVRWCQTNRFTAKGWLANPATAGLMFSLGTYGVGRIAGWGARAATAVPVAGAAAGALFAGVRRWSDLKADFALNERDVTVNKDITGKPRRETLKKFSYDKKSTDQLKRQVQNFADLSLETDQRELARLIAEIEMRSEFSEENHVDLITFKSGITTESERFELLKAMDEAKLSLINVGVNRDQLNTWLNESRAYWRQTFTQNKEQQDRAFAIYKMRNAAGAAAAGAFFGLGIGFGTQQGLAEIGRHIPGISEIPIVGGLFGKGQTNLEKVFRGAATLAGQTETATPPVPTHTMAETFQNLYQHGGTTELGNHLQAVVNADSHAVSIIDPTTGKEFPANIIAQSDGHWKVKGEIPNDLQQQLDGLGFNTKQGPDLPTKDQKILLGASKGTRVDVLDGHSVTTPDGTSWITDPKHPDLHDLVVSGHNDKILLSGVSFQENGHMNYDAANSILRPEDIHETPMGGGTKTIVEQVLGENGKWNEYATAIDHREWYAYDQPGSQGNELMYDTLKDGKTTILDMSHMQMAHQRGLVPNPIDVQEVIRNHEAGWYFSDPLNQQDGIWISDGADGNYDGLLHLDPDAPSNLHIDPTDPNSLTLAEASKILINQGALQKLQDGNIATELYNHRDVFNLGRDGKMGFSEAGRLVDQNGHKTLQAFATIRGSSPIPEEITKTITLPTTFSQEISIPDITTEVEKLIPTFDITPPEPEIPPIIPELEAPPMIPIPFAPRHPLEPLVPPEPPIYPERAFPRGARLVDILRRGGPTADQIRRRYPITGEVLMNKEEGAKALGEIKEALESADSAYIILGGAIGDAVMGTAAFSGLSEILRQQRKNLPITIIASQDHGDLFDGLSSQNVKILKSPRGVGLENVLAKIASSSESNPLVLDLEHYRVENPTVEGKDVGGKKVVIINNLLAPVIELYNNTADFDRRFSHYIEELFSRPKNSISPSYAIPQIVLPQNKDHLYENLVDKFKIDKTKPQVSVVVESQIPEKRYSVSNWSKVISEVSQKYPQYQFNIIFNPNSNIAGFREEEIKNDLKNAGIFAKTHLVSGSLLEMAILLEKQQLVLSNDTGLAHIATSLKDGPRVITLHLPFFPPNSWVSNPKRQTGILTPEDSNDINSIPWPDVANEAIRILEQETPARTQKEKELINQVNKTLSGTNTDSAHFETSPESITDFLKTVKLPLGAKIKEINARIEGDRLIASGQVTALGGGASFSGVLVNNPSGGIMFENEPSIQYSGFAKTADKKIREQILNLNQVIKDQVNKQIDQRWQVDNFSITNKTLAFVFKKKLSRVSTQPSQTLAAEMATSLEESSVSGVGFSEAQGSRPTMEDMHTIIENFGGNPNQKFFGIYDGHRGQEAAAFAARNLHENLLSQLNSGVEPKEALRQAYLETDVQIKGEAGATAVTALIQGKKLYLANAGDALAVISRGGRSFRLSQEHKATNLDEKQRIEKAGGLIFANRVEGILAVSRALGDKSLKKYVTADPYIYETSLGPKDDFLILACDGLWDVFREQEAVDFIKNEPDPQKASEMLKNEALRKGTADNISVLVVKLRSQS